jgi:hypothetical protein
MHLMFNTVWRRWFPGLTAAILLSTTGVADGSQTLVRDGVAQASIVASVGSSPSVNLAARELQHFFELITGTRFAIIDRPGIAGVRIAMNGVKPGPGMWPEDVEGLGLKRYEYVIRFSDAGIALLGRDAVTITGSEIDYASATGANGAVEKILIPGMFDDQGTLRATYDFLERFCGVRFYGPGSQSVVVPKARTLVVEGTDVRREPAIKHISGSLTWRWPLMNGQYGNPPEDAIRLYERRMRIGGIPWFTSHTLHEYPARFPRNEHPEFYADGGGGKLCYSSQSLANQVAQDARDYFDGKKVPDLTLPEGSDYYPVVPEDAATFCKCDECSRLLKPHAEDVPRTPSGRVIFNDGRGSHLWFRFVNRVARELRKTHPDKYLCTLAYESYFWYPTEFKLDSNVAIAPCMQVRNYWHMSAYANELGHYSRWVSDGRPVFLWNYYCFPEEPAVIRKWHCFPGFSAHELAKLARRYARDGVQGTFFCGIGEQVDFYVTLKLYDDPTLDVDSVLGEFFSLYFGDAAEPMRAFYSLIEETYANPAHWDQNGGHHQTEQIAWEILGTEARMAQLGALIHQAEALAKSPQDQERVSLWKTGVWDYMVTGRAEYMSKAKQK